LSKDSLVKGTFILTVAALVARALGVVQRVPLVYLLQEKGMAWYGIAFNLYSVLLVVATAGVPSALSKMISERTALGRHAEAERIYRAAVLFSLAAGVIMTSLLYVAAPYNAQWAGLPEATAAIRALAPALLLFPLIAIMRGYFQGRQNMMPNGLSQIIEQIFRVIASVGLAYALLGYGLEWAAAGASFGGVVGSIAAVSVMIYFARKLRRSDRRERERDSHQESRLPYKAIYGQLFRISIPIVIFSVTVTLIYTIDSMIVTPLLQGQAGKEQAVEMLGILSGRAQSLAGIPIILAVALSQSVVPIISAAYTRNDLSQVSQQAGRVLQLSVLTGLPMVLVICMAARPLNGFIFGNAADSAVVAHYAAPMIAMLTASSMFQIMMQTSGAVLMGIGRMKPLVASVVIGIAVKLIASFWLAPVMGIYGIIAATALCFIVMTALNLFVLRQSVSFTVLGRRWWGLLITTAAIVLLGWGLEWLNSTFIHPFANSQLNDFVQAVIACGVLAAAYPILLMLTRTVTMADVKQMPGPIQKLVNRVASRMPQKQRNSF
jgi:stage V sporulation protein B